MKLYLTFIVGTLLGGATMFWIMAPKVNHWRSAYHSIEVAKDEIEKERQRYQRQLTVCRFTKEFPDLGREP